MSEKYLLWKRALRSVLLVLLLSAVGMGKGYAIPIGPLHYELNRNTLTATVTGHINGSSVTGSLVIPEMVYYNGVTYSVTSIGGSAFNGYSGLTGSLIIPNSVTSIGGSAFNGCSGLTSVIIGNAVTSIGDYAFRGCNGLTSFNIPNSVIEIGSEVFYGTGWYDQQPDGILYLDNWCLGYKGAKPTGVLALNETTRGIARAAFSRCSGLTGNLNIPSSVTRINEYTFYNCSNIVSVTFGNSVTSIDDYAFEDCFNLSSVNFPNSLTRIGSAAFSRTNLSSSSASIPSSVTSVGDNPFRFTGWYRSQPDGVLYLDGWCLGYKGDRPTGDLEIVMGTKGITGSAFNNCYELTSVTFPSTLIYLTGFHGCTGITSVTIPNSVTNISDYAFSFCTNLTSIYYTGDIAQWCGITIDEAYFYDGYNLYMGNELVTQLEIPETVTSIGQYVFCGCGSISGDLIIPNSVTSIGAGAFGGCGITGDLVIPNSVTSIGETAFAGCDGITSVTIPNSVASIGGYAFSSWNGVNRDVFFDGDIAQWCGISFDGGPISENYNLYIENELATQLVIPETVTSIGQYVFSGCGSVSGNLIIPNSVTSIDLNAFGGCIGITSVTIPNSVNWIGGNAFTDCTNLESITVLAETPPAIDYYSFYNVPKSIPVHVPCGSLATYQSAEYWNEFTNIQESCTASQAIILSAGWNWFSANVGINLDDLKDALVEAFPGATISINSQSDGSTTYIGNTWRGNLTSLDPTQMYMISVSAEGEITLEGLPINPTEQTITIHPDFNWFVFPLSQSMTLTDAFAGFAVNGDMVISQDEGSSTYTNRWRGTLDTLEPGKGYMYKSNDNEVKIFVFPSVR